MSSWPVFAKCVNCEKEKRLKYMNECSHCFKDVCKSLSCCSLFPCANKENIVLCHSCQDQIEEKLVLVMDFSKLQLLKKKIKNNSTHVRVN